MSPTRRKFIYKSLVSTVFIGFGSTLHQILKATAPIHTNTYKMSKTKYEQEGIFPFYRFINDYHVGEYIPKDQGGKFIQMELVGNEDDKHIVEVIKNGLVENNLGNPPDWSHYETTELEKSVWFNRFYYLPSFARLYYLSKNKEYLEDMMALLNNWIRENPLEGPSKSRYNWYDMQVAWRAINLSWCYYMAKEGLSDTDKNTIYQLQAKHAKILMKDFGEQELNEFNHQSHGALAMLYLSILFPSLSESENLQKTAIKIINHHIKNAFYDDGGNVEQMFGYYPFMCSIFRDAFLLCEANKVKSPEGILPMLKKMGFYLTSVAQPDQTVPAINDSYEETVVPTIQTITKLLDDDKFNNSGGCAWFKDSQIGIIRSGQDTGKWYINMNAAKLIGSHSHAGRLAVNLWYKNTPILVDSGCCNYDNPLLINWYRTSKAHNTVIIDGKCDFATSQETQWAPKRYTDNQILDLSETPEYKICRMVSPSIDPTNSEVEWTRDIVLIKDNFVVIHDGFKTENEHNYETVFRFSDVKVEAYKSTNKLIINTKDSKLVLIPFSANFKNNLTIENSYYSSQGKNIKTPTSIFQSENSGNVHNAFLLKKIKSDTDIDKIIIKQKVKKYRCIIDITDENGQEISMSFIIGKKKTKEYFNLK